MQKFRIVNNETGQILCKNPHTGRRYRQSQDSIGDGLVVVETTKGRAQAECDYLNNNYPLGHWGLVPIIVMTARHPLFITKTS